MSKLELTDLEPGWKPAKPAKAKVKALAMQPINKERMVPTGRVVYQLHARARGMVGGDSFHSLPEAMAVIEATLVEYPTAVFTLRELPELKWPERT